MLNNQVIKNLVPVLNLLFIINHKCCAITCEYTNWRGKTSTRKFRPLEVWFGTSKYHKEEIYFLKAYDYDKSKIRDFAVKDFNLNTIKRYDLYEKS